MIVISENPFDPWQALQDYQASAAMQGQYGATTVFVGTMRDFNDGDTVKSMTLEHYPGMTEKHLSNIISDGKQQWAIIDSLVVHRVGDIYPDQPIVLVAVWAAHRGDACDACRFIIEALKSNAPFWKKEHLSSDQSRWVTHNSKGYLNTKVSD